MEYYKIGAFIVIGSMFLAALIIIIAVITYIRRHSQLRRYKRIELGMTEDEMLKIMGKRYNRSLLKDNRKKYEWRINASSTGTSYGGVHQRSYSGVKKVDIYVKNGMVEEVRPYNI